MKLTCYNCGEEREILVEMRGVHLKASCANCGRYIKFLSKKEKVQLEEEEEKLRYNHPREEER